MMAYQLQLGERLCRNCRHREDDHPHQFLCSVDGCRCPGFRLEPSTLFAKETTR